MQKKLNQRDIRALKIGAVAVAAILVSAFVTTWFEHWVMVRKSLADKQTMLEAIVPSQAKQAGLRSIVPVFEMPQEEEKQKFLFRNKFKEQIKKAGIKSRPLQILSTGKSRNRTGYKLLRLKCSSDKCKFTQILDLLASLKENPYLAGVEELKIKCDPKKRNEFKLDLTVSAFTK